MKITSLKITNFKSISKIQIDNIDSTLILVGKNNTGKSAILSAIKVLTNQYIISDSDYNQKNKSIQIEASLQLTNEDLLDLYHLGKVNKFKNYEKWYENFCKKLPSYLNNSLYINCIITSDGRKRYSDGTSKHNPYIQQLLPPLYIVDEHRNFELLHDAFLDLQQFPELLEIKNDKCVFDQTKHCNECFQCIPLITKKTPDALTLYESILLVKFKLYSANLKKYEDGVNKYFLNNYSQQYKIHYQYNFNMDALLKIDTYAESIENLSQIPVHQMTTSMKSLYILSLFQAYLDTKSKVSSIIIMEQPELHLHPELQKIASQILYKLSKKNQVIFTTHSPTMLFNFSHLQIKQIVLSSDHHTTVNNPTNLDIILDDLGYNASDLMNVNFVFIVEGKDDRSRLPLLLNRYYTEIRDENENLKRITIIPTNSCTNIRTYANLKFINQTYLKDNFLMVRDSDGKDPEYLTEQLCSYYYRRMHDDDAKIPRITPQNILILKYYSFENYFLNPYIMVKLGIIEHEEDFYTILFSKWQQYLYRLRSAKVMYEKTKLRINSIKNIKDNIETIKIYIRGHNLFDIYYGKYKHGEEQSEILRKYVELAPRDEFKDILDRIDEFIYFDNRKKQST